MQTRLVLQADGWTGLRFSRGNERVEIQFSHVTDAPRQLLEALAALLRGAAEAEVVFLQEPGEVVLALKRLPGDLLHLKVFRGEDWGRADPSGPEPVFREKVPLPRFASQVLTEFDRVLREHGEAGYRQALRLYDFPTAAYNEVRALVRDGSA